MKTDMVWRLVTEPASTSTHPMRPVILLDVYAPIHIQVVDTKRLIMNEGRGDRP